MSLGSPVVQNHAWPRLVNASGLELELEPSFTEPILGEKGTDRNGSDFTGSNPNPAPSECGRVKCVKRPKVRKDSRDLGGNGELLFELSSNGEGRGRKDRSQLCVPGGGGGKATMRKERRVQENREARRKPSAAGHCSSAGDKEGSEICLEVHHGHGVWMEWSGSAESLGLSALTTDESERDTEISLLS